ncbi:hypothetical protein KVG29_08770 [Caldicoprobacter algeriensis]|uniref:hypothetical protein n=1 Tax=Caldicoprobacter algeriensis TaxID=699281 RepID=UPI00207ABCDB|nr:hypothetical protein [Caldicoprobacter algeriensis]MCM8901311.1 hypothetical protein [Caldicoprobacter algeriensis]
MTYELPVYALKIKETKVYCSGIVKITEPIVAPYGISADGYLPCVEPGEWKAYIKVRDINQSIFQEIFNKAVSGEKIDIELYVEVFLVYKGTAYVDFKGEDCVELLGSGSLTLTLSDEAEKYLEQLELRELEELEQ